MSVVEMRMPQDIQLNISNTFVPENIKINWVKDNTVIIAGKISVEINVFERSLSINNRPALLLHIDCWQILTIPISMFKNKGDGMVQFAVMYDDIIHYIQVYIKNNCIVSIELSLNKIDDVID